MAANAFTERRSQDLIKLEELARSSNGRIQIASSVGKPINKITIKIGYKTAASNKYPNEIASESVVVIELPARYPFQEPRAVFQSKVFHPNVYHSGQVCFGTKWIPTEGLDLLVKRIVQIMTFDTAILNEKSPANSEALTWYKGAKKRFPAAFPSDVVSFVEAPAKPKIAWKNKEANETPATDAKVLVTCTSCNKQLRLPKGKSGLVICPHCKTSQEIKT